MRITEALLLCSLSLNGAKAWAQTDYCSPYLIPLVVRDSGGELVQNFLPGDIELKLNGTPIKVTELQLEKRVRRVVIVLDTSRSMNKAASGLPWRRAVDAVNLFASSIEAETQLSLILFDQRVTEEIGFERGNSVVLSKLSNFKNSQDFERRTVGRKRAINDAIARALAVLDHPTTADALLVVSNGGQDFGSSTPKRELERQLSVSGVRWFSIVVKPPETLDTHQHLNDLLGTGPDFYAYALETGGAHMELDEDEIKLSFAVARKLPPKECMRLFVAGLLSDEILSVADSSNSKKRELKITVAAVAPERLKGAQLFYPRRLYICGPNGSTPRTP